MGTTCTPAQARGRVALQVCLNLSFLDRAARPPPDGPRARAAGERRPDRRRRELEGRRHHRPAARQASQRRHQRRQQRGSRPPMAIHTSGHRNQRISVSGRGRRDGLHRPDLDLGAERQTGMPLRQRHRGVQIGGGHDQHRGDGAIAGDRGDALPGDGEPRLLQGAGDPQLAVAAQGQRPVPGGGVAPGAGRRPPGRGRAGR